MIKSIAIGILVILVLGLYFATEPTKGIIKATGKVTVDSAKAVIEEVKNNEELKDAADNMIESMKNNTKVKNG